MQDQDDNMIHFGSQNPSSHLRKEVSKVWKESSHITESLDMGKETREVAGPEWSVM
jgi:hypothetical protein